MIRTRTIIASGLFLSHPASGTGLYTHRVIDYLATHGPAHGVDIRIPTTQGLHHAAPPGARPTAQARWETLRTPLVGRWGANLDKVWWEQVSLPHYAQKEHGAVLYSPHFSLPLWSPCPGVITIHDLIPLVLPEYRGSRAIRAYFHLVRAAARRAAAVITVSHHARADIIRLLGIPPERVHVFYEGVDVRYHPDQPTTDSARVRARHDLPAQYALYLGGNDTRKNVPVLLDAWARLARQGAAHPLPPLVVVARAPATPSTFFPDLRGHAAAAGLTNQQVRFVDFVDDEDKPALYANASLFLYPSLYEGFGLPLLEAMASGVPVLAAQATSLPEIVGNAGLLLSPRTVDAWAQTLHDLWPDHARRQALAAAGRAQASQFRWETLGEHILTLLISLLGARGQRR